jgi:hypothetical protein
MVHRHSCERQPMAANAAVAEKRWRRAVTNSARSFSVASDDLDTTALLAPQFPPPSGARGLAVRRRPCAWICQRKCTFIPFEPAAAWVSPTSSCLDRSGPCLSSLRLRFGGGGRRRRCVTAANIDALCARDDPRSGRRPVAGRRPDPMDVVIDRRTWTRRLPPVRRARGIRA